MPVQTEKPATTRELLDEYFEARIGKPMFSNDIKTHFAGRISGGNVANFLSDFVKSGRLRHCARGQYVRDVSVPSVEDHRAGVKAHIESTHPRVVDGGHAPGPFKESLKAIESPVLIFAAQREFGSDILARMKSQPGVFPAPSIVFFERLLKERYPLTEQQELVIAQGRLGDLKYRGESNGRSV